jgi:hypothetical protein
MHVACEPLPSPSDKGRYGLWSFGHGQTVQMDLCWTAVSRFHQQATWVYGVIGRRDVNTPRLYAPVLHGSGRGVWSPVDLL